MPSDFDASFAAAADALQEYFGERNADSGKLDDAAVVIKRKGQEDVKCSAILSKESVEERVSPSGDLKKVKTLTAKIRAQQVKALDSVPLQATITARGKEWAVADAGSSLNEAFLTLALESTATIEEKPLYHE